MNINLDELEENLSECLDKFHDAIICNQTLDEIEHAISNILHENYGEYNIKLQVLSDPENRKVSVAPLNLRAALILRASSINDNNLMLYALSLDDNDTECFFDKIEYSYDAKQNSFNIKPCVSAEYITVTNNLTID